MSRTFGLTCLALLLWAAASCGGPTGPSAALLAENLAALENTVDTESRETDADTCLEFVRPLVDLGEVPMAESRSAVVATVNRTGAGMLLAAAAVCGYAAYDRSSVSTLLDANVEALSRYEIDPNCPNGCKEGDTGCYCNFWYPYARKAEWNDK